MEEIIVMVGPSRRNISFKVIPNGGSPYNCLFASVLQSPYILWKQNRILKDYKFSFMDMKELISNFIHDHWEDFKDDLIAQHRHEIALYETPEQATNSQLREAYKDFIKRYESLGTVTELIILSRIYKFNYMIFQKTISEGEIYYTIIDELRNPEFNYCLYLHFAGNVNCGHWELLEPIKRPEEKDFTGIPHDVIDYNGSKQIDLGGQSWVTQSHQTHREPQLWKLQNDEYETIRPMELEIAPDRKHVRQLRYDEYEAMRPLNLAVKQKQSWTVPKTIKPMEIPAEQKQARQLRYDEYEAMMKPINFGAEQKLSWKTPKTIRPEEIGANRKQSWTIPTNQLKTYSTDEIRAERRKLRKILDNEHRRITSKDLEFWTSLKFSSEQPWLLRNQEKEVETSEPETDYLDEDWGDFFI